MKRNLFILMVSIFAFSCNSKLEIKDLAKDFVQNENFPISVDSIFISGIEKGKYTEMNSEAVRLLKGNSDEDIFKDFCFIDSLKKNNAYETYKNDKSVTDKKDSNGAFALFSIKIDKTDCYVWYLHSIYQNLKIKNERKTVFISFVENEKVTACELIGELFSGEELPEIKQLSRQTSILKDGTFESKIYSFEGKDKTKDVLESDVIISKETSKLQNGVLTDKKSEETFNTIKKREALAKENEAKIIKSVSELRKKFTELKKFPYKMDSLFFVRISNGEFRALHSEQIDLLSTNISKSGFSDEYDFRINEFYKIDSLKITGKYNEYAETIDIGMMLYAEAYALYRFKIGETECFTWAVTHATQDACPYASGTDIFISFINGAKIISYHIAEDSGGSDAPVWGSTTIYTKITADGVFNITQVEESCDGETNEDGYEIIDTAKKSFKYHWFNSVFEEIK
jgi:hypothetical protein